VRDDWRLFGAVTVLDPENRQTGAVLPRRAKQFARLELDRQLGSLALGGSWIVQGERYDDVANTNRLGGYGLVNLRAAYALADNVSLRATLDNLLDQDYQTIATYRQPGRALFVTLALDTP
jgi:vitamin B12 transporter